MKKAALTLILALIACNFPGVAAQQPVIITATADSTAPVPPTPASDPTRTPQPTAAYTPRFEVTTCPAGYDATCGTLTVPQDRTQPGGLQVQLPVVIFEGGSGPPTLHLAGGPGSGAIALAGYQLNTGHDRFLQQGDYILFDQRGTGGAEPSLACPERWDVTPDLLATDPPLEEARAIALDAYQRCYQRLTAAGVDPAQYSSATSAADINDLRLALGHDQINLYGVSYGTRLALTVMRDYPQIVRSAILDSVYPPQTNLYDTWTQGAERAFEAVFTACAADATCDTTYPDLRTRFYTLVDTLNADPITVPLNNPNGGSVDVLLTGDLFVDVMFTSMYRWDNIPRFPLTVDEVERGVVSDFTKRFLRLYLGRGGSAGMTISVQCNEELAFSSMDSLRQISADVPPQINDAYVESFSVLYDSCALWTPDAPIRPDENDPIQSDIPTLILTGELDPITPPEWGPLAAETLPNATVVEFPAVGHWIVRSGQAGTCAMDISLAFLADPLRPPITTCADSLQGVRFR